MPVSGYDTVAYPPAAYPQTHPDRMATIGYLLGMKPPAVGRCRVLEIGCGDGSNLIPMAAALPGSTFLGVDLGAGPMERGRALIRSAKLDNVRLESMDLLSFPADAGEFDYIVAHGVYSWVPDTVRVKFWDVVRRHLAADGVMYVSYNCLPAGYLRHASRDLMRFHLARTGAADTEQAALGRDFVQSMARHAKGKEVWRGVLASEAERLGKRPLAVLRHDELEDNYQAFSFCDVVAAGRAAGFQYLAESNVARLYQDPGFEGALTEWGPMTLVEREQYLDYLEFRSFRETLFCREEIALNREGAGKRAEELLAATPLLREGARFRDPRTNRTVETNDPAMAGVLERLGRAWPSAERVAVSLVGLVAAGMVELRTEPMIGPFAGSGVPVASVVARVQLAAGTRATNLLHGTVEIADEAVRELVCQLDGRAAPRGSEAVVRALYRLGLLTT